MSEKTFEEISLLYPIPEDTKPVVKKPKRTKKKVKTVTCRNRNCKEKIKLIGEDRPSRCHKCGTVINY